MPVRFGEASPMDIDFQYDGSFAGDRNDGFRKFNQNYQKEKANQSIFTTPMPFKSSSFMTPSNPRPSLIAPQTLPNFKTASSLWTNSATPSTPSMQLKQPLNTPLTTKPVKSQGSMFAPQPTAPHPQPSPEVEKMDLDGASPQHQDGSAPNLDNIEECEEPEQQPVSKPFLQRIQDSTGNKENATGSEEKQLQKTSVKGEAAHVPLEDAAMSVHKRKRRAQSVKRRARNDDYDDEEVDSDIDSAGSRSSDDTVLLEGERRRKYNKKKTKRSYDTVHEEHSTVDVIKESIASRLFTFLESHPHVPNILSYYAQFTFNLILTSILLYIIITFLLAIRSDLDHASEELSANIIAEMGVCARNFVDNRCGGEEGKRLPALDEVCNAWERCMNRDPAKIGRAKLSAQTMAEIFNGFIETISFKTMIFFVLSITCSAAFSNMTFSFFRNKVNQYDPHLHQPPPSHPSHPHVHPVSTTPFQPHPSIPQNLPLPPVTPSHHVFNAPQTPYRNSRMIEL